MTSCVLSPFFLFVVFLCSSFTAVNPTGFKVRITDKAQNVVKDLALMFIKDMVHKPLGDFRFKQGFTNVALKQLSLTHLSVNPAHVRISFQPNSGLLLQFRELDFTGVCRRRIRIFGLIVDRSRHTFGGRGVSAAIGLKLTRSYRGRLNVQIQNCNVYIKKIILRSSSIMGKIINHFVQMFRGFLIRQICPLLQSVAIPEVNKWLEGLSMVMPLPWPLPLLGYPNIDFSLSGDVSVTSNSLDVPFKGLVFRRGDAPSSAWRIKGAEPQIRGTNLMVYVGISDLLLKSFAELLYRSGHFPMAVPKFDYFTNLILNKMGLYAGPLDLHLTDVPAIVVSQSGVSITVNARAQSLVQPRPPALPLTCKGDINLSIRENHLILVSHSVNCKVKPQTASLAVGAVNVNINKMIKEEIHRWFGKGTGAPLPLPEGFNFTQAKISYHQGFVVIGGSLRLTQNGRKNLLKAIGR